MKDLIDREAALNCYHDWVDQYGDVHTPDEIPEYRAIEALPSVQPERKRGKWIIHETETDRYDDMKCPFCKKSYTVDAYRIDDIGFTAADFNFCLNCGADMRGEQDE